MIYQPKWKFLDPNGLVGIVRDTFPERAQSDFFNVLRLLETGPHPEQKPQLSIRDMPGLPRPAYTIAFGTVLLAYRAFRDHPKVVLMWVEHLDL